MPLRAQGPLKAVGKVELKFDRHKFALKAGQAYRIDISGDGTAWDVRFGGPGEQGTLPADGPRRALDYFIPVNTATYETVVFPRHIAAEREKATTLKYAIKLTPIVLPKPALEVKATLSGRDPAYEYRKRQPPHKAYTVELEKGKPYLIQLVSGWRWMPHLFVEGPDGSILAQHEGLRSGLVFRPPTDAKYKIIVTTFGPIGSEEFRLVVRPPAK
jgi:hypothetical protein